jgi:hypothetical protein
MAQFKVIMVNNPGQESLFWSNEIGWVDYFESDTFTEEEVLTFNLPMGGKWLAIRR